MYFRKYQFPKTWLDKWLKTLRQTTRQMYRDTIGVRMTAPLKYLLITGKVVLLEKVFFSDTQIAKSAF